MMDPTQLTHAIGAIGGLGTAAYGLVDTSKVGPKGGVSNYGFAYIEDMLKTALPAATAAVGAVGVAPLSNAAPAAAGSALSFDSVKTTLRANWINGVPTDDQKAIAKSLIKLNLTPATAQHFAALTGVDPERLKMVAAKMATAATTQLAPEESDALGRFELALSTLMDQAYQRASQKYRNSCKIWAVPVALVLAILGGWSLEGGTLWAFFHTHDFIKAIAAGLLACPLAPVAKDLSSAVQAGAKVAQMFTK